MKSETSWPRFLVVQSASEDLPLQKLSLFAVQKGFQAIAGTPKNIERLRDGSFLVECGKTAQAQNLLRTNRFIDRPVKVSIHKILNSSRGVIRCRDLADMSEVEIRDELKDQGVVGVNQVTLKKEGKVIPTNTLFLTFGSPELPKEITVGYLKAQVALFVSNPMRCFNCNKFGHTSRRCKVAAMCTGCGKDKHEGQCEGPKLCSNCSGPHASSAKDCPVWRKEKEIQCVRVEKRISFPEARQLVEAKMPTVITGGKTYAAAASTRRESRSVQCQTSLTWVFSERPLRTTESNVRSSGGSGSVSTGTQASSGKSMTVSANARVLCESAKCSSETDRGSADPPKRPLGVPPIHPPPPPQKKKKKKASKGTAAPSKSAPKGSAGPLKTAASKDESSSSRCSPTKVRVDGVLVDVEGFLHPRCSTPSSRPQVPPKPVASDRLKKAEQDLVISNLTEAMEHSIIQWNLRGFQANFEELTLLSRRYKPAVFGLQETFLTSSKTPSFSGFNILTKNSLNVRATGGVALLINKSCLVRFISTPLCRRWLRG